MSASEPPGTAKRPISRIRRSLIRALQALAIVAGLSILSTLLLRWIPPLTSAVMVERRVGALLSGRAYRTDFRWVPWKRISPQALLAVIAAEDQNFAEHHGFDFQSIRKAIDAHERRGRRLRGASTISQQVAKNLFLWSGRSFVRKGLEAWFTLLIELTWPKRRILEVYLNIAELGTASSASRRRAGSILVNRRPLWSPGKPRCSRPSCRIPGASGPIGHLPTSWTGATGSFSKWASWAAPLMSRASDLRR